MIKAPRMSPLARPTSSLTPETSSVTKPWAVIGAASSIAFRASSRVASSTEVESTAFAMAASTDALISSRWSAPPGRSRP